MEGSAICAHKGPDIGAPKCCVVSLGTVAFVSHSRVSLPASLSLARPNSLSLSLSLSL